MVLCPDQDKFRSGLVEQFRREYEVIDVDGVRVLFGGGWGLVRVSNTQPVLVARCEAGTPEGLRRICAAVKKPWGVSLRLKNGNSPPDMV